MKSLEQACLEINIRLQGEYSKIGLDWQFNRDFHHACAVCGNNIFALFVAHGRSHGSEMLDHETAAVCRKCGKSELAPNIPTSEALEFENSKYFSGCNLCKRERLRESLDAASTPINTSTMPIISDSSTQNYTQVVPVLSLSSYFTQDFTLSVPPWQREYTWRATEEDGEVSVLLDDLKQFVEDLEKQEYLLGAVILCDTEDPKVAYLIDGQQRTVTLTLLIMCCYQYLKEKELLSAKDFKFQTKIHNMITGSEYGYKPHVNFTQKNANSILAQIYDWMNAESDRGVKFIEETDAYSKTQNNLLSVVGAISKKLHDEEWFTTDKLIPALEKILDGVKVIQLRLDSKREAIQAYDRINHRGVRLNDADLIKNQLFELVDDKIFDEISESWQGMIQTLQDSKSAKFQDPKYLIRAHAWTVWNKKITYDELADYYKKEYLGKKQEPLAFAQELELYAGSLVNYLKHKHVKFGQLPLLMPSQSLGSVQHFPLLLAGEAISSKEVFEKLYHQIASRTLLYVLSKERPPEFESYIPKWASEIRSAGKGLTSDDLDRIYDQFAFGPSDGAFETKSRLLSNLHLQVDSWRVNNSADKKKIRASLALMSWWMDQLCEKTFPDIDDFFKTRKLKSKGWDIEHISAIGFDDPTVSLDLKHSIGNLALLSPLDQRAAKNAAPIDKLLIYSHSTVVLSKTVTGESLTPRMNKIRDEIYRDCGIVPNWSLSKWNAEAIGARRDFYKAFLTKITTMELELPS